MGNPVLLVAALMSGGPEDGFMGVMTKLGTACGELSSSASACGQSTDCEWEANENKCSPSTAAILASLTPEQIQAAVRVAACEKLLPSNCSSNADCAVKEDEDNGWQQTKCGAGPALTLEIMGCGPSPTSAWTFAT